MRFGVWAAAAAALLCAGQASAATFVQFEARGTGMSKQQVAGPSIITTGDLLYRFTLEIDPAYTASFGSYGTGSTFLYNTRSTSFFASLVSGSLSTNDDENTLDQYGARSAASINFLPSGQATFSSLPISSLATGSVNYMLATPSGGTTITGTVNRIVALGIVNDYLTPFVGIVPELSTWAMMVAGIGMIGVALRRRRIPQQVVQSGYDPASRGA